MNNFLSQLGSLSWWLSVVLVGITVNVLSVFLSRRLDRWLSGASAWWSTMSEKRKADRLAQLGRLAIPHEQVMMAIRIINLRLRAVAFWAGAYLAPVFLSKLADRVLPPLRPYTVILWFVVVFFILGFLCSFMAILMGLDDFRTALRLNALLREARDEKKD